MKKNRTKHSPVFKAKVALAVLREQETASLDKSMKLQQGLRVGAVWVLLCLAKQLHIVDALGAGRQAKLALWQIMARIIEHSSRLSAVPLGPLSRSL